MHGEKTSQIRWLLIFWLFVLSAVAFLDRVNISIAGPLLESDYHLSKLQLGWIFSAFLAGYALFQTPGGRIADKLGARSVLLLGVLWWGVFTALTAAVPAHLTSAIFAFIAVRFVLGAGEAVIYPASNQFVSRWIPVGERGIANGLIFSGVGVGSGLTPPLITYLMLRRGWRISFLICALLGLVVGVIWYLIARNTPEKHPLVSPNELAKIKAGLPDSSSTEKSKLVPWERTLRSKEVLAVTLSYFTYGYVAWIFFSWFYIYLKEVRGLNPKTSALYSTLPFVAMALCSLLGGSVNDFLTRRWGPRIGRGSIAMFALSLAAVFLIVGSRAENTRLAVFVLAGGAGALYLSQSSFWSVSADIGGTSAGSVSGLMNMGNQIGGMITTIVTPWIASRLGWKAPFFVAAALCLGGAAAWLLVDPRNRLDSANN